MTSYASGLLLKTSWSRLCVDRRGSVTEPVFLFTMSNFEPGFTELFSTAQVTDKEPVLLPLY